jgi:tetratricopeptide (TPR) repeat protein
MTTTKNKIQPTITLCVIARDEEALLAECLDSARPYVDKMVVLDTGSTDRTMDIAREHGAMVAQFTWCDDFAAAKNAALDLATSDWILFMDADERLNEGGALLRGLARELPAGFHGYEVQMDNVVGDEVVTHFATRFFPRQQSLRFRHAIHETLEYVPAPETTLWGRTSAVRLTHLGYEPALYDGRAKDRRNLQILQRELERNPEDVWALFYLALQHETKQRHGQAILYLRRFMQHADQLPQRYTAESYRLQIQALLALGDFVELEKVAATAEAAGQLTPHARELLANYAIVTGQPSLAIRHYRAALDASAPVGVQSPAGSGSWRTLGLLANVYEQVGDMSACLEAMQRAAEQAPDKQRASYALITARVAARLQQSEVATRWLLVASEWADEDLQIHLDVLRERLALAQPTSQLPELEQAIVREEWQTAYDKAMALPLGGSSAKAQLLLVGDRLRESGAPDAALDLFERVLDTSSPSIPVYWRLTQTFTDLGRYDDAAMAADVLRNMPGAGKAVFGV